MMHRDETVGGGHTNVCVKGGFLREYGSSLAVRDNFELTRHDGFLFGISFLNLLH